MKEFSFQLSPPPRSGDREAGTTALMPLPLMFSPSIKIDQWAKHREYAALFGYVILLAEGLHSEISASVMWIECWKRAQGLPSLSNEEIGNLSFHSAVEQFSNVLDRSHKGSRDVITLLHKARKIRNRLIHDALIPNEIIGFTSEAGVESKINRLKATEELFLPLLPLVDRIGRWYAADVGFTEEVAEAIARKGKQQAEEAERAWNEAMECDEP